MLASHVWFLFLQPQITFIMYDDQRSRFSQEFPTWHLGQSISCPNSTDRFCSHHRYSKTYKCLQLFSGCNRQHSRSHIHSKLCILRSQHLFINYFFHLQLCSSRDNRTVDPDSTLASFLFVRLMHTHDPKNSGYKASQQLLNFKILNRFVHKPLFAFQVSRSIELIKLPNANKYFTKHLFTLQILRRWAEALEWQSYQTCAY